MKEDFDFDDIISDEPKNIPLEVDDEIQEVGTAFIRLRSQVTKLTKDRNNLRDALLVLAEEYGLAESGSSMLELHDEVGGFTKIVRQRKASNPLDEESATVLLKDAGLYEECTKQITIINEDEVMAALYRGDLSEEQVEIMFPVKESFALVVRK